MPSKQIVFINQSSGYLTVDIVNAFRDKYEERILFAGLINPRSQPLDADVRVEKLAKYDRSTGIRRMGTWILAFVKCIYLIAIRYRKADLFLVSNPPFTIFLPLIFSNRFSLLVYDIYPDSLVNQRIWSQRSIFNRIWEKVNRRVMARAEHVFTITESMKKVITNYADAKKIVVIPVWTDSEFLKPVPRDENVFIAENGFEDKFLVIYSGNLGGAHNVEIIVDIAQRIKRQEVQFLIIGEGDKKRAIEEMIGSRGLLNCRMMPWQETDMLPFSLSAADLALVTQIKGGGNLGIPSKAFSLMSVGAPLLCITEKGSELSELVRKYGIGGSFEEEQVTEIVEYIYRLLDDKAYREQIKSSSIRASMDFTSRNARSFAEIS